MSDEELIRLGRYDTTVDTALDLHRAMTSLTDEQRRTLALVMAGYTHQEAAARLGVTRRVVGYRVWRAIATLRRQVAG